MGWIDLLCVLACFLVILSHCCDPFVAVFDNDRPVFLQGVMAGSLGRILPALVFWSLLLPYVRMAAPLLGYAGNSGNMGLYGECDWNIYGTFYYVSGFAGYIVLAFYLVKFPLEWSWCRLLAVCIPSFAVGYLITLIGFVEMQRHFPGDYACLETIWYFAGIDVFLMTVPVFLIVQKATVRPRLWLARLAGATFGIYLCHFIFVQGAYDLVVQIPGIPTIARILLMALMAFAVSYVVAWTMRSWRVTRRFVE